MDKDAAIRQQLQRALADKELTRQELARLPIEEKLEIVARMQRRANAIRRAAGRPEKPEWPLREPDRHS